MYARDPGLGFWSALVPVGVAVGRAAFSDDSISIDEYYPAVKSGRLVVPGPFDIQEVAAALDYVPRSHSVRQRIDAKLRQDPAWVSGPYAPLRNSVETASALVNWAHGGRDLRVKGAEAEIAPMLDELLEAARQQMIAERLEAERQAEAADALRNRLALERGSELITGLPATAFAFGALALGAAWLWGQR